MCSNDYRGKEQNLPVFVFETFFFGVNISPTVVGLQFLLSGIFPVKSS